MSRNHSKKGKADKLDVYYDGNCTVCSLEIRHYQKQNGSEEMNWVDISNADFDQKRENLEGRDVHFRIHSKQGDRVIEGVDTFVEIWKRMPRYHWLARFIQLPVVRFFANLGYELFIRLRPYLPKKKSA